MIYEKALELATALKSGDYKQTTGTLSRGDSFCCLGVACELSKIGVWAHEAFSLRRYEAGRDDSEGGVLPKSVMEYYGMYSVGGNRRDGKAIMIDGREFSSLMGANDDGATFEEIADYILANHEAL